MVRQTGISDKCAAKSEMLKRQISLGCGTLQDNQGLLVAWGLSVQGWRDECVPLWWEKDALPCCTGLHCVAMFPEMPFLSTLEVGDAKPQGWLLEICSHVHFAPNSQVGLPAEILWEPAFPTGAAGAHCSLSGTAACHLLRSWAAESRGPWQVLVRYLQAQHPPIYLCPEQQDQASCSS